MTDPIHYSAVRDTLKSGDLVFLQSSHWKARLVRWWTESPYSHVGVLWRYANRVFVLEAVLSGVRIYPLSHEKRFWLYRTPAVWTGQAEDYAMSIVGQAYSQFWAVLAGAGFKLPDDDGVWECAEYARNVLLQCDYPQPAPMRGLANVRETPAAMARWCTQFGEGPIEVVSDMEPIEVGARG